MTDRNIDSLPIVILDIDGVISPMYTPFKDGDFVIRNSYCTWILPVENVEWFKELDDYTDLRWGSSWEDESNLIAREFLNRDLPYLDFHSMDSTSEWTKIKTMLDFVMNNPHRQIIIVDDEMTLRDKSRLEAIGAHCYIPDTRIALTEIDRVNIMRMILELSSSVRN